MSRLPIKYGLRFEILKRDGFKCVYCGNPAKVSPLHVDHKKPVAEGGTNEPDNLVTACQVCNAGKGDFELDIIRCNPEPEPIPTYTHPPDFPKVARRKLPAEAFRLYGRKYRVFKRKEGRYTNWYFLVESAGKRYLSSLRTSDVAAAVERAKLLVVAQHERKLDEMRCLLRGEDPSAAKKYCTPQAYLELYERTATGENRPESRHHAVLAFTRMATRNGGWPESMDKLEPMFKAARASAAANCERAKDNTARMSMQRTFNSELASAASTFSEMAVFHLKDKLTLPDFTALRTLVKFLRFQDAKKTTRQYNPPTAAVLDATLDAWTKLPRNEFLAFGMALACGMRRSEIREYADWSWFEVHNGYLWCNARGGDFKDRTDVLRCQVLEPFWSIIVSRCNAEGWRMEGPVITGNRSEFDRNISAWMRDLGWDTAKHLHALRAWAGSLVYQRYGIAAAAAFCRHADEQTTKDHYAWLKPEWHAQDQAVTAAGRPVEWARGTDAPATGRQDACPTPLRPPATESPGS